MEHGSAWKAFYRAARLGNAVPLWTNVRGAEPDPVSAFQRIRGSGASFILERADSNGRIRKSLMGFRPLLVATFHPGRVEVRKGDGARTLFRCDHPVAGLRQVVSAFRPAFMPGTPAECVGFMGAFHYEVVRHWEQVIGLAPHAEDDVEGRFFLPGQIVEYDHETGRVRAAVLVRTCDPTSLREVYEGGLERLHALVRALTAGESPPAAAAMFRVENLETDFSRQDFESAVETVRGLIRDGEAIQVVLSRRLTGRAVGDDIAFYRKLRSVNPSPYLFHLSFGKTRLVGASPEMLVRLKDRTITLQAHCGHETPRADPGGGSGPGARASAGSQGEGRARDARGPGPERRRPGREARFGPGRGVYAGGTLQPRYAPGLSYRGGAG